MFELFVKTNYMKQRNSFFDTGCSQR